MEKKLILSSIAESGTRTYYGEIKLDNTDNDLLLKMIGTPVQAKIIFDKLNAIKLKDSAVYIDDNGVLNAKLIDDKKIVHSIPVSILESNSDGTTMFTSDNLKNKNELDVIVRGAGFLKSGDEIKNVVYSEQK